MIKNEKKDKPFAGVVVYYSGSIHGSPEPDEMLPTKIKDYLLVNGANVLSEHVAASTKDEMRKVLAGRTGKTVAEFDQMSDHDWALFIRKTDIDWVNRATHVVALVNGASHGVGMELQRALDKPRLGLSETPILCLRHADTMDTLSLMIRGITKEESPSFTLVPYKNFEDIKRAIDSFFGKK